MVSKNIKTHLSIKEIARLAGVGTATVDRVLHGRGGVSSSKVQKVMQALERDNSKNVYLDKNLKKIRLGLVIHSGEMFVETMKEAALKAGEILKDENVEIKVHQIAPLDICSIPDVIKVAGVEHDGLAIISPEGAEIHDAVDTIVDSGKPVITVTTDLPSTKRIGWLGMNSYTAGRTAGYLMNQFLSKQGGEVIIVVGHAFRCQEEREMGFRSYLREKSPHLKVREVVDVQNDQQIAYEKISNHILDRGMPLGFYAVSGGNLGVSKAIEEFKKNTRPIFIGHELNRITRSLLIEEKMDSVFDHDSEMEMLFTFRQLTNAIRGEIDKSLFITLTPKVVFRENIS